MNAWSHLASVIESLSPSSSDYNHSLPSRFSRHAASTSLSVTGPWWSFVIKWSGSLFHTGWLSVHERYLSRVFSFILLTTLDICADFMDEQNSPQAMGVVQHQAPDTTSPSPPHQYTTNGNTAHSVGGFPSAILSQGSSIRQCQGQTHEPSRLFCFADGSVPLWAQASTTSLCKFENRTELCLHVRCFSLCQGRNTLPWPIRCNRWHWWATTVNIGAV